jgi:hypothetical protein
VCALNTRLYVQFTNSFFQGRYDKAVTLKQFLGSVDLGLDADFFSRLYLNGITVHEVTHFLDLLDPDSYYFAHSVFQLVLWIATARTAAD